MGPAAIAAKCLHRSCRQWYLPAVTRREPAPCFPCCSYKFHQTLAVQVHAEFEYVGQAGGLTSTCLYGGSPYPPQEQKLRRGVHIIVGTPGRIQDHIDRGTLKMQKLRCVSKTSTSSPCCLACINDSSRKAAQQSCTPQVPCH